MVALQHFRLSLIVSWDIIRVSENKDYRPRREPSPHKNRKDRDATMPSCLSSGWIKFALAVKDTAMTHRGIKLLGSRRSILEGTIYVVARFGK